MNRSGPHPVGDCSAIPRGANGRIPYVNVPAIAPLTHNTRASGPDGADSAPVESMISIAPWKRLSVALSLSDRASRKRPRTVPAASLNVPLRWAVPINDPDGSSLMTAFPVMGNARPRSTASVADPSGAATIISRPQTKERAESSRPPVWSVTSYSRQARPSTELRRVESQRTSACRPDSRAAPIGSTVRPVPSGSRTRFQSYSSRTVSCPSIRASSRQKTHVATLKSVRTFVAGTHRHHRRTGEHHGTSPAASLAQAWSPGKPRKVRRCHRAYRGRQRIVQRGEVIWNPASPMCSGNSAPSSAYGQGAIFLSSKRGTAGWRRGPSG